MTRPKKADPRKTALLAVSDLRLLADLQRELSEAGWHPIVARDLPSLLLALTQNYFELAIVGSRISEEGDGWPASALLRMLFPSAFIAVLVAHTDVLTIKSAINSGIDRVLETGHTAQEICAEIAAHAGGKRKPSTEATVH